MALVLCCPLLGGAQASLRHPPHKAKKHRHQKRRTPRRLAIRSSNAGDTKRVCAYSAHSIATLDDFGALIGRDVGCAMVFNEGSATWSDWERPWFIHDTLPDNDWKAWATTPGVQRELVISQSLIPEAEKQGDWRRAGAAGNFVDHATALARNLVAAGLGDAVIRLAPEMNGDWNPDSIGNSETDFALWREFWRKTVLAMRAVPGAGFSFDWCINAHVRPIPLASFYPGDDVVDIVGIDAYDTGVPAGLPRWQTIFGRTDGLKDVVDFAQLHHKPLSIPEWGVAPTDTMSGGGDDAEYIDGIASVVRDHPTAYQAYFYKYGFATQLANGPASLAAYRRHFGDGGDSVMPTTSTPPTSVTEADPVRLPGPVAVAAPAAPAGSAVTGKQPTKRPRAVHKKAARHHRRTHRVHRAKRRRPRRKRAH